MVFKLISYNVNGNVECIPFVIAAHRPDVLAAIEGHSRLGNVFGFSKFYVSNDLTVYIRQDMSHRFVKQSVCPESHEITIFEVNNVMLAAAYLRKGRQAAGMLKLREMCQGPYPSRIIMGDLNANFVLDNAASRALRDWLEQEEGLFNLNDPDFPTFSRPQCTSSLLDYCIVSRSLLNCSELQVIQDFHSDHRPIMLSLGLSVDLLKGNYSDMYSTRSLNLHLRQVPEGFSDKLEELVDEKHGYPLHDLIDRALKHTGAHRRRRKPGRPALPGHLVEMRKIANLNQDNVILRKTFRRSVRKWRRDRWLTFCQEIDFEWTTQRVWKKFKASLGRPDRS